MENNIRMDNISVRFDLKKSISINVLCRFFTFAVNLLYTPLLLRYLGDEQYGVWVTLSSIVNWVITFDIGIGNGLRNLLAKEIVNKKYSDAKYSVSTAYTSLTFLVLIIYAIGMTVSLFLNWNWLINTKTDVFPVFSICYSFVCFNFILALQNVVYYSIQKSEFVSVMALLNQFLSLFFIFVIIHLFECGNSLIKVSLCVGISGIIVNVFATANLWIKKKYLIPNFFLFDKKKLRVICSFGLKIFLIQIASVVIFSTDNLIVSNLFTPSEVTPYNTVYKVYGIGASVFFSILLPFWSRFTVARERNEYVWMNSIQKKLLLVWGFFSFVFLCSIPIYQPITNMWLGKELHYESGLIVSMVFYHILYMYSAIYSTALNGLGIVKVQLCLAVISAIINIPLSFYLAKYVGLRSTGVCIATIVLLLLGNIIFTIHLNDIIRKGMKV